MGQGNCFCLVNENEKEEEEVEERKDVEEEEEEQEEILTTLQSSTAMHQSCTFAQGNFSFPVNKEKEE